jgi:hypothetical protein
VHRKRIFVVSITLALLAALSSGCLQPRMSYQGRLTDPSGNPVPEGTYDMAFRLYSPGLPSPIMEWEETQVVTVTNGLFNVVLGTVQPITPSIFANQLTLGVEVNGDGEMQPRMPLTGAPYAMSLVDGAVMAGVVTLDAEYPAMLNVGNLGDGLGIGVLAMGKGGVGIDGEDDATNDTHGLFVRGVEHGGAITATAGYGLRVRSEDGAPDDWWAVAGQGYADGGGDGGFFWGFGTGDASTGVTGRAEEGRAIYGFTEGSGQYAGYFDDPIYVNGGCTGCTFRYVARNTSEVSLQPGAAVVAAGVDAGIKGMQSPVMKVIAAAPGQTVLGVIAGRTRMSVVEPGFDDVEPGAQFGPVGGAAAPGDYLVIVVQGPAQVKADPAAGIQAGSPVYLGATGVTVQANGPAIGMALDAVDADGLVWVLVGLR